MINYLPVTEIEAAVQNAINAEVPFSLVRLGDGEWEVLKYGKWSTRARCLDRIGRWFDTKELTEKQIASIRNQILRAFQTASIVGIPSADELRYYAKWRSFDVICKALNIKLNNTFYFHNVLKLNYQKMLSGQNVVCITCRDIGGKIKANINPKSLKMILIKAEQFAWKKTLSRIAVKRKEHYREQFAEIHKAIMSETQKGRVYLVGAGGLGKSYCNFVKAQGGVAIDVGALFDAWAGVLTRPYLKTSMRLK